MSQPRFNATVFLTIALPLFAVVASVGTAIIALSSGDSELPGDYHWEGVKLDRDFAAARRAAQLHVEAELNLRPVAGMCHLTLRLEGPAPPAVDVAFVHASRPALDRHMRFLRTAADSLYSAPCTTLPSAGWHIELSDPGATWRYRADMAAGSDRVLLSAGTAKIPAQ